VFQETAGWDSLGFPNRIYTLEEFAEARKRIEEGHRYRLRVAGSPAFRSRVGEMLKLIRRAGCHDRVRTYIRQIVDIDVQDMLNSNVDLARQV
jgi:hypothetical protein